MACRLIGRCVKNGKEELRKMAKNGLNLDKEKEAALRFMKEHRKNKSQKEKMGEKIVVEIEKTDCLRICKECGLVTVNSRKCLEWFHLEMIEGAVRGKEIKLPVMDFTVPKVGLKSVLELVKRFTRNTLPSYCGDCMFIYRLEGGKEKKH